MKYSIIGLVFFVALLETNSADAHPGQEHPPDLRVWKDKDGLFEIEASFVLAQDDRVQLRKHDGTMVWVPLDKLSLADRVWVKSRVDTIRRLNGVSSDSGNASAPTEPATSSEPELPGLPPAIVAVFVLVILAGVCRFLGRRATVPFVTSALLLGSIALVAVGCGEKAMPAIQKHFEPFKDKLKFRSDADYFYVESDGFPDHPMMIGIKAWQQQVPLPQPFTGRNAWQIPLRPRLAEKPISAKKALFSGAIAVAVNGVPIFNALNNRGEDAFLIGELDEYGGHCGRGDDYHYHAAPVHLEKVVGKGNPIGYALDGFPLYGFTDADGKEPGGLDEFNGRMEKDGYRYYSTRKYPYINGGLRGVVTVRNDRVEPQPRDIPIRPAGRPLRGAKITDFIRDDAKQTYTVKYDWQGKTHSVKYTINGNGAYTFVFTDGVGKETTETYRRQERKQRPPEKDGPRPRPEPKPQARPEQAGKFTVTSPAFANGGDYPVEFTGDGAGISPPLAWSGAPAGTKCYALQLWHVPGSGEVKSYWVVYDIPADVTSLPRNARGSARMGTTTRSEPATIP